MIEVELDYANGNTTPGAFALKVYDAATGEQLFGVVEADAREGWFRQIVTRLGAPVRDAKGKKVIEHHERAVRIVRLEQDPTEAADRLGAAATKRARKAARQAKGMA